MKALALILAATMTPALWAESYSGTGETKNLAGETTAYEVRLDIGEEKDGKVEAKSVYTFNKGGQNQETMEVIVLKKDLGNDFFDLVDANDVKIGSGYCLTSAPTPADDQGGQQQQEQQQKAEEKVCHMEFTLNGAKIEETSALMGKDLYRVGSKTEGDAIMNWREKLTLVQQQAP